MKKRLAPILSAAVLIVCLIYPIILQKPTGKGEEMSLYEAVLRDLDEQFGIDRYDITYKYLWQVLDDFRFTENEILPQILISGDGNHTAITDYLTEYLEPVSVYRRPVERDLYFKYHLFQFSGFYGKTRPLGNFQRQEIMFDINMSVSEDLGTVEIEYSDGDGGKYEVYYDIVK